MKKISKRSWMAMALAMALLAGLLIFVGSYFVNAKTWVTFPGSPHVYTGVNPDCGRIYDRSGMLLLNTDDGRVYNADETIRRSTMHLLGDRDGYISAPLLKTYASKMFGFDVVNGLYTSEPGSVAARLTISAACSPQRSRRLPVTGARSAFIITKRASFSARSRRRAMTRTMCQTWQTTRREVMRACI